MKLIIKSTILLISTLFFISLNNTAEAQWAVGASYEIRSEDPTNGFGARIEREFLRGVPLFDVNVRAHLSYFNDTNNLSISEFDISGDFDVYDFGLATTLGMNVGIVKPYVGLGIGTERYKFSPNLAEAAFKERGYYYNGFGGAEVSLLPYLKPFIEYRISRLSSMDDISFDNIGRFAVGLNIRF
ncbi:MAG: outer membrane beta-barrel protein [Balneolaceae bacterium]|nr:outer membrane beta-barrel protein [Balneolaceae bacterium]